MKKRISKMFLCGMILTMFVTGCRSGDVTVSQDNSLRFQPTGNSYIVDGMRWNEYVDTKTNNLYIVKGDGGFGIGFSPLYDENGKIAKYSSLQSIGTQGIQK